MIERPDCSNLNSDHDEYSTTSKPLTQAERLQRVKSKLATKTKVHKLDDLDKTSQTVSLLNGDQPVSKSSNDNLINNDVINEESKLKPSEKIARFRNRGQNQKSDSQSPVRNALYKPINHKR